MKPGDKILFAFPILLGVVVCAIAGMLFFSTREFEKSYIAAEMRDVMTEAELVSDMIRPMLLAGNVAAAVDYCEKFPERSRRATLVREDGAVVEFDHGMDDALRMHDHVDALQRHAEEIVGFDDLKTFVQHGCAVHGDLAAHVPCGMGKHVAHGGSLHLFLRPCAQRTARGSQVQPLDGVVLLRLQALENG